MKERESVANQGQIIEGIRYLLDKPILKQVAWDNDAPSNAKVGYRICIATKQPLYG